MTKLSEYLSDREKRAALISATGNSRVYLWQVATGRRRASTDLARRIEEHTSGDVPKWSLRPDVWEPPTGQSEAA